MRKLMGLLIVLMFAGVIILPALIIEGIRLMEPEVRTLVESRGPVHLVHVLNHQTGEVKIMPLETYLVGVVAGEMPASFEKEALKAQAVAARTYTLKKILEAETKGDRHQDAHICTDAAHCQAWLDDHTLRQKWGLLGFWRNYNKIQSAVEETRGMVMTYQGKLIDPVYHSNAGGRTENAVAVWGGDYPYLQSVSSPWDEDSSYFHNTMSYSLQELENILGVNLTAVPAAALTPPSGNTMKVLERTATGRVKTVMIGDRTFAGTELRGLLGLHSTDFTWQVEGDRIHFYSIGFGHGVGMSQYGANGMAREGRTFMEILMHYYRGVKIEQY